MSVDNASKPPQDLATWIGRRQAFGLIASKFSVADAYTLKHLREGKQYKSIGMTWEDFCSRHLGISRTQADRIISQLEEFGAAYFALCEVVRIPPEAFRQIAPCVSSHAIDYNGRSIPITHENGFKIACVIKELREQAAQSRRQLPSPDAPRRLDARVLLTARRRWNRCFTTLSAIAFSPLHPADRPELAGLVCAAQQHLEGLSRSLREPCAPGGGPPA